MMDSRDRAFLDEMVQFTIMNHVTAVRLYRQSLTDLNGVALLIRSSFHPDEAADARSEAVAKNNDSARIERIVIAKIFAELMSAYEDLGALGHAIRKRSNGGIFYQYLISESSEAANFLIHTYKCGSSAGLDRLLKLPSMTALSHKSLDPEVMKAIEVDYVDVPKALYDVARISLTATGTIEQLEANAEGLADWRNDLNILLNVDPPPPGAKSSSTTLPRRGQKVGTAQGATLVDAFNKIKHRFMVTDNLPEYVGAPESGKVVYGRFGITQEFVDKLVKNTIVTAMATGELASLLIHLDRANIKL